MPSRIYHGKAQFSESGQERPGHRVYFELESLSSTIFDLRVVRLRHGIVLFPDYESNELRPLLAELLCDLF